MNVQLSGFDDLENDLTNMAAAMDNGPAVNRALRAGAVPIEAQMKRNASTDPKIISGDLHDSIHTGSIKGEKEASALPSVCTTKKKVHITQILWSLGTADPLRRQRILLFVLLLTPNPMKPMTK